MADQGDRVAAVVARVATGVRYDNRTQYAQALVRALDNAGLLLTAARRERIVRVLQDAESAARNKWSEDETRRLWAGGWRHERDALLRELAGDGGAPASEPTPAPRRMFGPPDVPPDAPYYHAGEHDERHDCALGTPCQPVAAAAHDPRDFDPGAGGPMGVLPADPPAHEHRWAAVAWDIDPGYRRVTREHCTRGDCTATREVGHGA